MAYMHMNTYELLSVNGIEITEDEYLEVDDLIALPLQELNKKGYPTMPYSYSGDIFAGTNELIMNPYTEGGERNIGNVTGVKVHKDGSASIYVKGEADTHACINFAADAPALPSVPDGWDYHENFLEYWFDENLSPYDYLEESVRVMCKLYEWTCSLPDMSKVI